MCACVRACVSVYVRVCVHVCVCKVVLDEKICRIGFSVGKVMMLI